MRLIGSLASPFVRKVRVVMAEKKIEYKLELVDVWSTESASAALSPLGKIPCLIIEDGGAMFDSRVIAEYLDNVSPVNKLIPPMARAKAEVKTWEALADGVLDAAILARLESTQRADGERSAKWLERQLGKVATGLNAMSVALGNKDWACEGKYTLADISMGCALGWLDFRFPQIDWRGQYSNLDRLTKKLNLRRSFLDTAPR